MIRSSRPHRFHALVAPLAFALACLGPAVAPLAAAGKDRETWHVQGQTYSEVRVREVTPATVTIFHRGGIAQLELAKLPPELQKRFCYDAGEAQAWQEAQRGDSAGRPARHPAAQPPWGESASAATFATGFRAQPESEPSDTPVEFRDEVDLRPVYFENGLFLKDQGRRPSCSIFALVSALEYETARRHGSAEPLSEDFLIWAVRKLQPGIPIDDGYHFSEVLSALQTHGVPRHALMPNTFGVKVGDIEPSQEAQADAATRRGVIAVWLRREDPRLLDRLVGALNRGTPVIVGVRWPHWRTLERNNLLRDQKPLDGAGHAVTLIGYRCPAGVPGETVFLFRNSYGVSWGLGGCGLVAASYLREHLIAAFHLTLPEQPPLALAR